MEDITKDISYRTVLLAKGLDAHNKVIEVQGTQLINEYGDFGQAYLDIKIGGMVNVPAHMILEGRIAACKEAATQGDINLAFKEPIWQGGFDAFGEMSLLLDKKGIVGRKGRLYKTIFQNGGPTVNSWYHIRHFILGTNGQYSDREIRLEQEEMNQVLDAVKKNDGAALRQMGILYGGSIYTFRNFNEFAEESARKDFLKDAPGFVALRPDLPHSCYRLKIQENEDFSLILGSTAQRKAMLDIIKKMKWTRNWSKRCCEDYGRKNYGIENSSKIIYISTYY